MNMSNIILFIFGATFALVAAEAPLPVGPYPAPTPVYGPPQVVQRIAPYAPAIPAPVYAPPQRIVPTIPTPVYGPPQRTTPYVPAIPTPVYGPPQRIEIPPPQIVTNYDYNVYTPAKSVVVAPYAPPTPIIRTTPYQAPAPIVEYVQPAAPVLSTYSYNLPKYVPAPAPTPVYAAPKYEIPYAPTPVYGPPAPVYVQPKISIPPPTPVLTSYDYPVYTPQPAVKTLGPYPAPAQVVRIPEAPIAPHTEYGSPVF
ncbi:hypothetical protein FQA39_LY11331 [Lamprigera yunnana]|nr:hypothetical protein FQA39_LY11331 [Lamprigera yunnana]